MPKRRTKAPTDYGCDEGFVRFGPCNVLHG